MPASDSTAFVSYSRSDAEFAMRLASELKAAGADVWLDQLDIAPGQRWDRAVEKALNDSPVMLVVLSPAAVESTNVMDEVSYALDERKTVIPLIVVDCPIPFRLRRIQHVDFRKDHPRAVQALLRHLGARALRPDDSTAQPTPAAAPPTATIGRYEIVSQVGGPKVESLAPGTMLGRYKIVAELRRTEISVVYRGKDTSTGFVVAIKQLVNASLAALEDYLRKARWGALKHENIAAVYDHGELDGRPYIVMEFIPGESLERKLSRGTKMPLREKLDIVRQVCLGIGFAHRQGVIHRDIKPEKIMVEPGGRVKILDFGISSAAYAARESGEGIVGTFPYIAPERLKGEPWDGRSDIWSIGLILYQLLAERIPFPGNIISVMNQVLHEPLAPLSDFLTGYPPELDDVLARSVAKDPALRYAHAEEMAEDLGKILEPREPAPVDRGLSPGAAEDLKPGTRIGSYEIISVLGRGSSGVVYLARDREFFNGELAIKMLSAIGPKLRERYLSEMRPMALPHPNIAPIYGVGEHEGIPYVAMERVRGTSLDHILKGDKVLQLMEKLRIARQICEGLAFAHSHGVLHNDLRPANIIVQPDGLVKILNLGMVRGPHAGSVVGSFPYISPERMKRQPPDERSDIWSVGVLFYLLLAGNLPFSGQGVFDEWKAVHEPYRPLSKILAQYPSAIDAVIKRALDPDPQMRYAKAEQMAFDIRSMVEAVKRQGIE